MSMNVFAYICISCIWVKLLLGYGCQAASWDPSSDPLPPLQPKEVGFTTFEKNNYTWQDDFSNLFNVQVYGYQFQSFENQFIYNSGSGLENAEGKATRTWSYTNYTVGETCYCTYGTQDCICGDIEGGGSMYQGYDYYRNLGLQFYNMGYPTYYYTREDAEFGTMMVWDIVAPWNDTVYPRHLNYTLEFQNSTGYLRLYSVHGYEYCCKDTGACLNIGERFCTDGSPPVLLHAQMNQHILEYQLILEPWPTGFFGAYFPSFPSTEINSADNDDDDCWSDEAWLVVAAAMVPVATFFMGVGVSLCITTKMRSRNADGDMNTALL